MRVYLPNPAPEKKEDKDTLPEVQDMGIDVGTDADTARAHTAGDIISFKPNFRIFNDNRVCSKSQIIGRAWRFFTALIRLKVKHLILILRRFLRQEELGCRGLRYRLIVSNQILRLR